MKWNCKNSTYYDKGKKAYGFGDDLPSNMDEDTVKEYKAKGLIAEKVNAESEKDIAEKERLALLDHAKDLGLSPHPRTGIEKLNTMIDDAKVLIDLKDEALALGIDPSDDVKYDELKKLVDEKKAGDE